jgi:hypothetical protein
MYNTSDQTAAEIFRNSSCCDIGHDWKATTAPNYRVCTRAKCHAAQRFHQGQWVDAPGRATATGPATISSKPQALPLQPLSIWAGNDLSQQGA